MARRNLTKDVYDLLVAGFRESPGNASHAARFAGTDRRLAARSWSEGWSRYEWAPPIREALRREFQLARAERAKLQEAEREQQQRDRASARKDALRAQGEEAQAANIARANGVAVGALISALLRSMLPLTKKLQETMDGASLTPKEMVKIFGDAAYIVRQGNEAIKTAFELERIRLGEPTQVLGITTMSDATPEEAAAELMGLNRTLRRALKQQGDKPKTFTQSADGTYVIELPDEAFEEGEAQVVDIKRAKR